MIARLYTPDSIGSYATVVAVATVISPFATAKIEAAITPASSESDAYGLFRAASILTVLVGVTSLLCVVAVVALNGLAWSANVIWLGLPALVVTFGWFSSLIQVSLRQKAYRLVAQRPILQNATILFAQASLARLVPSGLGLVGGELIGRSVGLLLLRTSARNLRRLCAGAHAPLPTLWSRYGGVVMHYLPGSALDTMAGSLLILLPAMWFGSEAAGFIGMTQRLLAVPVALVGAAIGQVLIAEVAHERRTRGRESVDGMRAVVFWLCVLGALTAAGVVLLGPILITAALGPQWAPAGTLAQLIAVPAGVSVVWNPLSAVFVATERWRPFLIIAAVRVTTVAAAGFTAFEFGGSWEVTVAAMAYGAAAVQIAALLFLRRTIGRSSRAQ